MLDSQVHPIMRPIMRAPVAIESETSGTCYGLLHCVLLSHFLASFEPFSGTAYKASLIVCAAWASEYTFTALEFLDVGANR